MGIFNRFGRYLGWKYSGICNFNPVIVNSNAYRKISFLPLAMTKSINDCFSQCIDRHFKALFPLKTFISDFPTQIQMLEKECYTCIKEVKEISFGNLIINEFVFINTSETC